MNSSYDQLSVLIRELFNTDVTEDEMTSIINVAKKQDGYNHNIGIRHKRTEDNPREKAFYEEWMRENEPNSWVNCGQGILQDLFIKQTGDVLKTTEYAEVISNRDRRIVATVIQWLGSNCGMAFLSNALSNAGYKITLKSDRPE